MQESVHRMLFRCSIVLAVLFLTGCNGGEAIISDHTCTDISEIPSQWITAAKNNLRIFYGHTSHGSQIITGMGLMDPNTYTFHLGGGTVSESLSIVERDDQDLGAEGNLDWVDTTRTQLNSAGNNRNVVVWSWCGGVSDNTEEGINTYLQAMNQLETDYPSVTFVYMTGHLDGTGVGGNLNVRNEQIRTYCRNNGKILFDFADIESYDPNGSYYLDQNATDACHYDGGNWADQWCAAHAGSALCATCDDCDCAHSRPLNCNLKARAFWWMLARIAGWDGPSD